MIVKRYLRPGLCVISVNVYKYKKDENIDNLWIWERKTLHRRPALFYFVFKFIIHNFDEDTHVVMKDKLDNDKIVNKFLLGKFYI